MLSYHICIICKLHINRYLYLLLAGFPCSISLNSLKSPIMIHRLANRITIKQFSPYVLSCVDYRFYHMSSYYLVNLVLLIKCQSKYLSLNVLTNVYTSLSIHIHKSIKKFCIFIADQKSENAEGLLPPYLVCCVSFVKRRPRIGE